MGLAMEYWESTGAYSAPEEWMIDQPGATAKKC
jgi:hypothetical protein